MPIEKVPVSKFDEPEPGAVSGAVVERQQMSVGWNSVKQLAAILGLYAATFFLLDATASPACLVAATAWPCPSWALPRGFLWQLFSVCSDGCSDAVSCDAGCDCVPVHGVSLDDLEKDLEGSESAAFDVIASLAASLPLVFDNAAAAGPAALSSLRFQLSLLFENEPAFQEG